MPGKIKNRKPRSRGIAETYIHIKDVPSDLSKEKVQQYLKQHAWIWAKKNFKHPVIVKVRVEEGSLKVWVFVGGLSLINFVSDYGSFRSGIDQMVSDAKAFSSFVIEHFSHDEDIPDQAVIRAEKRLGVPGKIQRFLKSLENIDSQDLTHNERQVKIQDLRDEFLVIVQLLDNPRDRQLFMEQVPDNIKQTPNIPLPEPIPGVLSLDVIRNEED
ncbi:hypothetical protein QGM61_06520 [Pseudohongiella sp. SYSU M77423]|uniref:hypothetical protein n=1 Tax=Pseudohongiella sp. SYSU M77423 TaxID=3042312 RepID=UPI0024812064|nr:hypothetical protein [Pseudohongiella sp. SYSU M77423]MDH7943469.1 hypothetical protein [Pseudohongiella sp. SYSU M77423]